MFSAIKAPPPRSEELAADWTTLTTWTGFSFKIRSADPSDEAALADFFTQVTPEDRRFRFLSAIPRIDHDLLERLTKVDHERSEDFLAFDGDTLIASAMLATDPTMERAEVAISIRADYKRRGVGRTLLDHISRHAAAKGVKLIESIECRDNLEAIAVETKMGFTATAYPGDPTLMLVQKQLA